MSKIELFSKIELPPDEVYKQISCTHTLTRCISPFFNIENIRCKNSKIDLDTHFVQKSVFFESLQLFYKTKEIVPNSKIQYEFDGLIKGFNTTYLINDENNSILRESIDFSLFNQFNFLPLELTLALFFYIDTCIKHLRLKNIIYKDSGIKKKGFIKECSTIRSYIVIDANIDGIASFFDDLNKFSLWISPFLKVENTENEFKEDGEFSITFVFPVFPSFKCKVIKKKLNKIEISFSNSFLKGNNTWSIFPCENQLVIENTVELSDIQFFLKFIWLILGNTLVRNELDSWNKRLKEIAEKTNLSKYLKLAVT